MTSVFLNLSVILTSIVFNIFLTIRIVKTNPNKYLKFFKRIGWFDKTYNPTINKNTFVILTFGQSGAGNNAKDYYEAKHEVYNYYNGKIYKAEEPLKGCNGNGGISVWTRFADKLIEKNLCEKVILVPIARGGTWIDFWAKKEGNKLLIETLESLKSNNLKLTHVLWHQGAADNGGDIEAYKAGQKKILQDVRKYTDAPFFSSINTYLLESKLKETKGIDYNLQQAQKEFIAENTDVYLGVNTDILTESYYRYDGQHFTSLGNKIYAQMWVNSIENYETIQ